MTKTVLAHAVAGEPGSRLASLLERRDALADGEPHAFAPIVVRLTGPEGRIGPVQDDLPPGPVRAEAALARLRAKGVQTEPGEPVRVAGVAELAALCRERGAASVQILRTDPGLVPHLQLGGWFAGGLRLRAARRAGHRIPARALAMGALLDPRALELLLQGAFWAGVRAAATEQEWLKLTRGSYTALYFHQIAADGSGGRLNVSPARFRAQLRLLRRLRFKPVSPERLLAFHAGEAELPARSYVLTADDGLRAAVAELTRAGDHVPQLFVPTGLVGGTADWADGAPLAGWDELASAAAAGVAIGSHTRTHPVLADVAGHVRADELAGSLADLRSRIGRPLPVLAYPHGRHDGATRAAAAAAGYAAAYTTAPGRNGAWCDPFRLKRVGVKDWDSRLSLLWKATTGELLPRRWERRRLRRFNARRPRSAR